MSTTIVVSYSDHDMQCPANWENGFKEGIVEKFGEGDRALSHPVTGDWRGSTFTILFSDHRRNFRQRFASLINRYSPLPLTVRMTTRANRAALGTPYTVFVGPIIDAQPRSPLAWEVTLSDVVSQSILSDQAQVPWRQIKDGPLSLLAVISELLDREAPEPIIYGEHLRIPDFNPEPSPQGFVYTPTYLGIRTVGVTDYHMWMVCGHAVDNILDAYALVIQTEGGSPSSPSSLLGDEGTIWLIPHHGGYNAQFGGPYEDLRGDTYGTDRRYTTIYGKVGEADPDACAIGEKTLAVAIQGVEPNGDGSGEFIQDRLEQYKHFCINYVANFGPDSYQTGDWLTNPTWDVFGDLVGKVDEDSFDACSAIAALRLPVVSGSPQLYPAGYIGAAIIGAHAGDRKSVKRWIADWNRSCSVRFGITHLGQMRVVMLHPTAAIKAAAPLYTDAYEILRDSFSTSVGWSDQANRIPFVTDYEHVTGQWKTADAATSEQAVIDYQRVITGELREYPFAPGITMAYHLAQLEVLIYQHPPRTITLEATIGPGPNNESLGYLDLGDYIRYRHFASISDTAGTIRLAQIVRHQVQAGQRRVQVEALDCEDLIDYDAALVVELGSPGVTLNETCADAIDMGDLSTPFEMTQNTTAHATDMSVSNGSPPFGGSGVAYHAAWFKITGNIYNGVATFSSVGSDYDTQIVAWSGSCGALVPQGYNDNFGVLQTSVLDVSIVGGTDYFILVAGYGPDDAGTLSFRAVLDIP